MDFPASDRFVFPRPLRGWKAISTSDTSQTVMTQPYVGCPSKLRQDLTSPGFSAYFDHGIRLKIGTLSSPILSWGGGGSLDGTAGLPTPEVRWVVVSFRDNQPPLLFAFPWNKGSLKISGKTGDWVLSSDSFKGWMRVAAPLGVMPFRTNSAAEMGRLEADVKAQEAFWTQPPPIPTDTAIFEDDSSLTVEWTFDRPGAVVPPPAFLSGLAGYPVQILSKTKRIDAPTLEGPLSVTETSSLKLKFPIRRVPLGRVIGVGPPPKTIGTASYIDVAGVFELALANLYATTPKEVRVQAEETCAQYVENMPNTVEPHTGQRLPYGADGVGIDVLAAQALLMQSNISGDKPNSEPNSLFSTIMFRRDWLSWRIWGPDRRVSRRASAITAIAAALAPEADRRLDAAMLQAGIVAERGLGIWLKRSGLGDGKPLLETAEHIRADIFMPDDYRRLDNSASSLRSPLRLFGAGTASLEGTTLTITPNRTGAWVGTLASAFPLTLTAAKPTEGMTIETAFGFTVVTLSATKVEPITFSATIPGWVVIPALPGSLEFKESER
ncbi:MAG: hypothetical protein ABL949_08545 [Fimbriimonadaceae bacterium]